MKHGDFTLLAKDYVHRPGYSLAVLRAIVRLAATAPPRFADVGAGTGKLTENLLSLGLSGVAVEPNDSMRAEGERLVPGVLWQRGSGEATSLPTASADWVLMGSSFHWTNQEQALQEFHRVLKPGGLFTALWNPRDVERSELEATVEALFRRQIGNVQRVSSGSAGHTAGLEEKLVASGQFGDVLFMEAPHHVDMPRDRYLGVWRSVNDLQVQAGPQGFEKVMAEVAELTRGKTTVRVNYRTRAWTVRRRD